MPHRLASLDSPLYVVNASNTHFGAENYMANSVPAITAAVNGGNDLIIFDRYVNQCPEPVSKPGAAAITALRDFSNDRDGSISQPARQQRLTNGANGQITNVVLGDIDLTENCLPHGLRLPSLPSPGANPLAGPITQPDRRLHYPFGAATVFIFNIPLDLINNPA